MYKKVKLFMLFVLLPVVLLNISCTAASSTEGVGKTAPDFTLSSLKGESVTLSQFRNKKSLLLVFGATWCRYCVDEIPELKEVYSAYNDEELKLLYVDIQESERKIEAFVNKHSIPYTVLLDTTGSVANTYGVRGIPHQLVIDKNGSILYKGPRPYQGIMSLLDELLKNE